MKYISLSLLTLLITAGSVVAQSTVVAVWIVPAAPTIAAGATQQLALMDSRSDGIHENATANGWSSTNTAVATVSSTGLLTAFAPGTTTIRSTTSGLSGVTTVTVK